MSDDQPNAKDEAGPEEAARFNYAIPRSPDADTEGHMPLRSGSPEPAIGDEGAPETPVTDSPDADAEGHAIRVRIEPAPAADADEEASTGGAGPDEVIRVRI